MCSTSFRKCLVLKMERTKWKNELEWNVICEREKYIPYLLIIDVQIGSKISKKYLQFGNFFGYLFYWGSNLNTIGFCQRCGDTLPLIRNLKIYIGFDLTVSFVKMQMRPPFFPLLFFHCCFQTLFLLFSSVEA